MNKTNLRFGFLALALCFTVVSCTKKQNNGISPTYGSTGNPNPNATVTGATTYSNPATENTSMYVGGSGWSNPSCGTTNSLSLKGLNGSVEVTLGFASPITGAATSYTYNVSSNAGPNTCVLSILNAPNQPSGIIWYGKSGIVVVNTTSTSINASFNNVVCTQQNFNFPAVTASGILGCSQ